MAAAGVPVAKIEREALAIYPFTYDSIRDSTLLEVCFRVKMCLHNCSLAIVGEGERGIVNVLDTDALRGFYRSNMALYTDLVVDTRIGYNEQFVRACVGRI